MRILQVVHSLPFLNQAGTEVHTYNLSLELSKRHQVYIFSRVCNTKQKEYEVTKQNMNGVRVYLINNTFKNCNSFKMYYENEAIDKRFVELLDEIAPDIVHIQHLVFLSIGLIKTISERGIPIVFTLHDYWLMCLKWHVLKRDSTPCEKVFSGNFDQECLSCLSEILHIKRGAKKVYLLIKCLLPNFALRWLKNVYFLCTQRIPDNGTGIDKLKERARRINALLNGIDFFTAPSECLKNKFIEFGIPSEKINVSQNGLDGNLFIDIQKIKANKIRFAFIGTILPAKGLHILIKSFNRIKKRDAELKIYGRLYPYVGFEYYPPYLKKIIKNRNIRFAGEFNYFEIAKIFSEIDILIVPSVWYENSPLVIKEAFFSKTPVIASRIGGIPELVTDGLNGLLFNPQDADDLQEKIQYLIDNPGVIEKFKENIPRVKSIEDNASEIEDIYNKLIAKKESGLILQSQ